VVSSDQEGAEQRVLAQNSIGAPKGGASGIVTEFIPEPLRRLPQELARLRDEWLVLEEYVVALHEVLAMKTEPANGETVVVVHLEPLL
jgi:hypothetical protein